MFLILYNNNNGNELVIFATKFMIYTGRVGHNLEYFSLLLINKYVILCVVSNEVPEHPVVSPVSGSIFEKRLIEKYLAENGVDPITGKELTVDQLIDIKSIFLVFLYICL